MARGIKRRVLAAQDRIQEEIHSFAREGFYAAGLAGEGYQGGYLDALSDVLLLLNGCEPDRRGWWRREPSRNRACPRS